MQFKNQFLQFKTKGNGMKLYYRMLMHGCLIFFWIILCSAAAASSAQGKAGIADNEISITSNEIRIAQRDTGIAERDIDSAKGDAGRPKSDIDIGENDSGAAQGDVSTENHALSVGIEVRPSAEVNFSKIYLKEIADIAASKFLKQQIENVDLGFAPKFGEVKGLSRDQVISRITSCPGLPEDMVLQVPEQIFVKRACQDIPESRFRNLFMDYVKERVEGKEFHVRDFEVRNSSLYKKGDTSLVLVSDHTRDVKGRLTLYVNVDIDGEKCDRAALSGIVDVFDHVVTAARTLRRGSIVSASDLCVEKMNISNIYGQYLSCKEDAVGMSLKTSVRQGRHIRQKILEDPPMVYKGKMVQLIASSGNLCITTSGVAREDGRLNDQIPVENIRSGRIVHGVVIGKSIVKGLYQAD